MSRHGRWELPTDAAKRAALNLSDARALLKRRGVSGELEPDGYLAERTRLWSAAFDRNMERRFEEDRFIEPMREHWSAEQAPSYDLLFGAAPGWKKLQRGVQVGVALAVLASAAAYTFPAVVPFSVLAGIVVLAWLLVALGVVTRAIHVVEDRALLQWTLQDASGPARGIPGWTRDSGWVTEGTLLGFAVTLVLLVALLGNALLRLVTWVVEPGWGGVPVWPVVALVAAWASHRLARMAGRSLRESSARSNDAFRWLGWVDEDDRDDGDAPEP